MGLPCSSKRRTSGAKGYPVFRDGFPSYLTVVQLLSREKGSVP